MAIYADTSVLVETFYIAAVTTGDGEGPADGMYWLLIILDIGGKPRHLAAEYHTQASRDAAFAALRALVMAEADVGEE